MNTSQHTLDRLRYFSEVDDDNQVYEALFKGLDREKKGLLSLEEIISALKKLSSREQSLLQVDPVKLLDSFQDLERQMGKSGAFARIDWKTFLEVIRKVPHIHGQRVQWSKSLNLECVLARRLPVGELFDGLSGLKILTERQLETILHFFCNEVCLVVKSQWKKLCSQKANQAEVNSAMGKFSGFLGKFGDIQMFNQGLETQIGSPDPLILKGIFRENVFAKKAKARDVTSNYKILHSDFSEYARLLGNSKEYKADESTKLSENEINPAIPILLTEIAKGLHGDNKGPNDIELRELEANFHELREFFKRTVERHRVFPGDIGSIQKVTEWELSFEDNAVANEVRKEILKESESKNPDFNSLFISAGGDPSGAIVKLTFTGQLSAFVPGDDKNYLKKIKDKHQSVTVSKGLSLVYIYQDPDYKEGQPDVQWRKLLEPFDHKELQEIALLETQSVSKHEIALVEAQSQSKDDCIDSIVKQIIKSKNLVTDPIQLMPGRRYLSLREMMDLSYVRDAKLRVEEVIQAHQYTGPMFQVDEYI